MPDSDFNPESASVVAVIPARWSSSRFPGKPLHLIGGKLLVQHVWDQCSHCRRLDDVVVATDDERIAEAVRSFGGKVAMTSSDHPSGTDRIAEAVRDREEVTHVINVQGDEPMISPQLIDSLAGKLIADPELEMITAANPLDPASGNVENPNVVKLVMDSGNRALYFSRSPIPYERNMPEDLRYYQHKGIYGYRRDFLLRFVSWKPSMLERAESLEQLRALENGTRIHVVITEEESPGIDTPEQAAILERLFGT